MFKEYRLRFKASFIFSLLAHGAFLYFLFHNYTIQIGFLSKIKAVQSTKNNRSTVLNLKRYQKSSSSNKVSKNAIVKPKKVKESLKKKELADKASLKGNPLEPQKQAKKTEKTALSTEEKTSYAVDFSRETVETPDELKKFFQSLINEFHRKKSYPRISKRLREQGLVHIKFEVDEEGQIKNPTIKKECSYSRLNQSAKKVFANLKLKERPPKGYGKIEVIFPVEYVL